MTGQTRQRVRKNELKVKIPVLLYHRIVEKPVNKVTDTSIRNFRATLEFLQKEGYTTLTSKQYVAIMNGKIQPPEKPILLTFDDATPDFMETVVPNLDEFGMNAILFVVTDWIDGPISFSEEHLKGICDKENISVENHSFNHDEKIWGLNGNGRSPITREQAEEQITKANEYIEKITGRRPLLMAYPYGSYNEIVKEVNRENGIEFAFKVGYPDEDRYAMGRHYITEQSVDEIAKMIAV